MDLDTINAMFELVGAYLGWRNVATLLKAKRIDGVYLPLTGFYVIWGFWNAYYYAGIGHWWSFAGQVVMVSANLTWLLLAIRYSYTRGK